MKVRYTEAFYSVQGEGRWTVVTLHVLSLALQETVTKQQSPISIKL
jgi:hypothetical protein